jgi:hypothetical protein
LIDVRFEPTGGGTIVRVLASIPAGGVNEGDTAWVTVMPPWFGAWCAADTHVPWVFVDDLDAHFASAQAAHRKVQGEHTPSRRSARPRGVEHRTAQERRSGRSDRPEDPSKRCSGARFCRIARVAQVHTYALARMLTRRS